MVDASPVQLVGPPEHPPAIGNVSLHARDVKVTYRVYEDRQQSMRQYVSRGFRTRRPRLIEAVKGISLTARAGESIGVIGPNGSGKSTLLRALAGLLPLDGGTVHASSHPSLLGIGVALKPALSGRRNILIGGLALGLTRQQVRERMDDIVDFADLRDSIDLPIKTYSSGMRSRLHFGIATAAAREILFIDEALAVGDKDFRAKSEARIRSIQEQAGTIMLVSHGLGTIVTSCDRAIWVDKGRVVADGPSLDVVNAYRAWIPERGGGRGR